MDVIGIDKENYEAVKGFFPADTEADIEKPEFTVYAVVDDGESPEAEVYGVLSFFTERAEDEYEVKIDWIYVAPEKRGMGVGALLVDELVDSAKKAGVSYVHAELPDDENGLESFFENRGFSSEVHFLPFFEGTVAELSEHCKGELKIRSSAELMKEVSTEDRDELIDLFARIKVNDDMEGKVHIDLSDEAKAAVFDEMFEDCSVTVVKTVGLSLEVRPESTNLSLDEALNLLNEKAPYLMPRFTALTERVAEITEDYRTGADSLDGPYILLPAGEDVFEVRLFISLAHEDTESFMITAVAEFDIYSDEIDKTKKRIEQWEDEAIYATAGIDTAYGKLVFEAGMACDGEIPAAEDIRDFVESFTQEVKDFRDRDMTDM